MPTAGASRTFTEGVLSAQPMEYVFCLAGDNASRRQDLKGFYELLTQGMSSPPKFP